MGLTCADIFLPPFLYSRSSWLARLRVNKKCPLDSLPVFLFFTCPKRCLISTALLVYLPSHLWRHATREISNTSSTGQQYSVFFPSFHSLDHPNLSVFLSSLVSCLRFHPVHSPFWLLAGSPFSTVYLSSKQDRALIPRHSGALFIFLPFSPSPLGYP